MPVQHIRPQTLDLLVCVPDNAKVREADGAPDRHARQAECEIWANFVKQAVFVLASGGAVTENANLMPGLAVLHHQVPYVAEDPADR
jgi:hypothetical protein